MKSFSFSFLSCTAAVLVTGSLWARADSKPDFEDDAKPILSQQPGLIEFVEAKFQVKDTGVAKYPGDDDHAPTPPYIFRARPRGSHGPYTVRLLIQPGPPGHILGIVNDSPATQQQSTAPVAAKAPAPSNPPTQAPQVQASAQQPPALTSDTPSGPISASNNNTQTPAASPSSATSLAPPPDPAPQPH